jgi:hypothetical protein
MTLNHFYYFWHAFEMDFSITGSSPEKLCVVKAVSHLVTSVPKNENSPLNYCKWASVLV